MSSRSRVRNSPARQGRLHDQHAVSAVVLASGYGSRLRPLTDSTPKAMLDIGGHPYLAYLVAHHLAAGVREVLVTTGWLGHVIAEYLARPPWCHFPVRVLPIDPVGTGYTLVRAAAMARNETVLVVVCDVAVEFDLASLVACHRAVDLPCTFVTCPSSPQNQGAFFLDEHDRIVHTEESMRIPDAAALAATVGCTSSTGAALFEREVLSGFAAVPGLSLETDVLPALVAKRQVLAFDIGGQFFWEFGTPERLAWIGEHAERVVDIYGDPLERLLQASASD